MLRVSAGGLRGVIRLPSAVLLLAGFTMPEAGMTRDLRCYGHSPVAGQTNKRINYAFAYTSGLSLWLASGRLIYSILVHVYTTESKLAHVTKF